MAVSHSRHLLGGDWHLDLDVEYADPDELRIGDPPYMHVRMPSYAAGVTARFGRAGREPALELHGRAPGGDDPLFSIRLPELQEFREALDRASAPPPEPAPRPDEPVWQLDDGTEVEVSLGTFLRRGLVALYCHDWEGAGAVAGLSPAQAREVAGELLAAADAAEARS